MSKDELIHKAIAAADGYSNASIEYAQSYGATSKAVIAARRECIEAIRAAAAEPVNGDTIQASAIAEHQSMQIPHR